uniref:PPM-type phosphatase domain-containing protein n=1 Tax=Heterorhabditis bacteriophora TaxID=37862 RepID=A0A1I7XT13_HETBA
MTEASAKRKSATFSLYDDDDETSTPPIKKVSAGLYEDDSHPSTVVDEDKADHVESDLSVMKTLDDSHTIVDGNECTVNSALAPYINPFIAVLGLRRGQREDMQDAHLLINNFDLGLVFVKRCALYAIFDGHAGAKAAKYCEKMIPEVLKKKLSSYTDLATLEKSLKKAFTETFKAVDEMFLIDARKMKPVWKDGTTVTCILLLNDALYVANLGDSKAIVCRRKSSSSTMASIELTVDHNPTAYEERMRIQKAGGTVKDGRINGIIEVSRSIGDGQFKTLGVTCIPDMKKLTLSAYDRCVNFLILNTLFIYYLQM